MLMHCAMERVTKERADDAGGADQRQKSVRLTCGQAQVTPLGPKTRWRAPGLAQPAGHGFARYASFARARERRSCSSLIAPLRLPTSARMRTSAS